MRGLMMETPLSVISLLDYAANYHGEAEIVSRTVEGPLHRYTYRDSYARTHRLAHALRALGVEGGDRVATLAWNTYRHYELYFAIPGMGAVCHTVNPRLFPEQIAYILNHAGDKVVFTDLSFVPLLESLAAQLKGVGNFVIMTDDAHMPDTTLAGALCYETLIAERPAAYEWPRLDEYTASSLCYSSGTTGSPKGTLYTHRSTVLHSFAACLPDNFGFSSHDSVLPVVPMFHVNAWGIPYACAMVGAKLVLPGPRMDGPSLHELLESEKATFTAGVPTVWFTLLEYMRDEGKRFSHLNRVTAGGAAVPRSMVEAFEDDYGVEMRQGWGMTETSPVCTMGRLKGSQLDLDREARLDRKTSQGRTIYGVEMKIVDEAGARLPRDGKSTGELRVRGPWVLGHYFEDEAATRAAIDGEGWLRSGDVATHDEDGYVRLVDRTNDMIKSGGEWISSIEIENAAVGHPDVAEAGAIGLPHAKWGERPLLIVVPKEGRQPSREQILAYLSERLVKIAVPDDVAIVAELPHTATGKVRKTQLREDFKDHKLPTA